jgi:dethiobiotin synthetase
VGRILFVTGTDTGVGKTLLTALLLQHLRSQGVAALAMKPFCTGPRSDVHLLQSLQAGELRDDEANPVWLRTPLAPRFAAEREGRSVDLSAVRRQIQALARRCECLIVEGAGGALVPVSPTKTLADFMAGLPVETVITATNRLGVINQVSMTVEVLRARGIAVRRIILMGPQRPDSSTPNNATNLAKTLASIDVFEIPFLRGEVGNRSGIQAAQKKLKKVLARIWGVDIVCPRSLERFAKANRPSAEKTKKSR